MPSRVSKFKIWRKGKLASKYEEFSKINRGFNGALASRLSKDEIYVIPVMPEILWIQISPFNADQLFKTVLTHLFNLFAYLKS